MAYFYLQFGMPSALLDLKSRKCFKVDEFRDQSFSFSKYISKSCKHFRGHLYSWHNAPGTGLYVHKVSGQFELYFQSNIKSSYEPPERSFSGLDIILSWVIRQVFKYSQIACFTVRVGLRVPLKAHCKRFDLLTRCIECMRSKNRLRMICYIILSWVIRQVFKYSQIACFTVRVGLRVPLKAHCKRFDLLTRCIECMRSKNRLRMICYIPLVYWKKLTKIDKFAFFVIDRSPSILMIS